MKQDKIGTESQIKAVKAYAMKHYNKGWDIIIECYSDGQIAEAIHGAKTAHGAICKLAPMIKARHAYATDIQGA